MATAAVKGFNLNDFPKLEVASANVSASCQAWLLEFELSIEMVTLKLTPDFFQGRIKLLALLHTIGKDGRDALQSLGFDMKHADSTYDQAMNHLKSVYEKQESVYVKTMRFVTVSQTNSETECDYLLRTEKLSRTLNFGDESLRREFALAIAVNGLRNSSLRTQLMQ